MSIAKNRRKAVFCTITGQPLPDGVEAATDQNVQHSGSQFGAAELRH
jgi:hypothetical protein